MTGYPYIPWFFGVWPGDRHGHYCRPAEGPSNLRYFTRIMDADVRLVVLAGADYLGWVPDVPNPVEQPLRGLQIGQRLQWLSAAVGNPVPVEREPVEVQGELF